MKLILSQPFVNSVGLVFDIVGVLLIFFYALPVTNGKARESSNEPTDEEVAKSNKIARFGLGLLVLGFVLQLLSNFM